MNEINYLDATEMRQALARRDLSAQEVVSAHLDQVESTAHLNSLVTIDAEAALKRAKELDRIGPDPSLALFGLPLAVKDTHNTAGLRTTYGSTRHSNHVPARDALHVSRMKAAGGVVLGKSNVPEYAAGSHTTNRVFGPTHNPYAIGRSAGGSSGGSAAALAARQVALADGSDMGGSLRNPASFCNVVGFRPSPGVVPRAEAVNLLTPLGTAGPMGRTVDDVELLLSVIGRPHPLTPHWGATLSEAAFENVSFKGLKVAWAPTLGGRIPVEPEVLAVIGTAAEMFESQGATLVEASPFLDNAADTFLTLRAAEFYAEWGDAIAEYPEDFNERIAWNIEYGRRLTGHQILQAQEAQTSYLRAGAEFFTEFDVLLSPAAQVVPFPVELDYPRVVAGQEQQHYLEWMSAATMITMLGTPAISVPAGFTPSGLPVGLQMTAGFGRDMRLLSIARAYEALTRFGSIAPTSLR